MNAKFRWHYISVWIIVLSCRCFIILQVNVITGLYELYKEKRCCCVKVLHLTKS